MAKKKSSAKQRAHRKWFAEQARKGAFRKTPAKKRKLAKRKNAVSVYEVDKPLPKVRVKVNVPSTEIYDEKKLIIEALSGEMMSLRKEWETLYRDPFSRKFMLAEVDKQVINKFRLIKKLESEVDRIGAAGQAALDKIASIMARGGKLVSGNSKHKSRRNPKDVDYGMITVGNPRGTPNKSEKAKKAEKAKKKAEKAKKKAEKAKKSRKKATRRRASRRSNKAFPATAYFKLAMPEKRRAAMSRRRKSLRGKVTIGNPMDMSTVKPLLYAAGGYVLALGLYKAADFYSKGQVGAQVGKVVPPMLQPFLLPAIGMGIGYAMDKFADKLPAGQRQASDLGRGAMLAGGVLAALAAVNVGLSYAKANIPQLATIPVIGPMLSGVMFFPAQMSGADFGQIGDGYHQQPGDFGNVRYFPGQQMSGVEFFPTGSRGDEMYVPSEADQLREAQGLGVIPEGMDGIPEGLGEDMGQMG